MKKNIRLIARLDIKSSRLIKGINLEGLRVVGNPFEFAQRYYQAGIDEIIYMDAVASLYERNNLEGLVDKISEQVFVPATVGGGIRSLADADRLMRSGADKLAINTAAIKNPSLITSIAKRYGSQAMVLSIEAKRTTHNSWEAYTDNGRNHTGLNVINWIKQAVELGAGEILLTSVDQEGMCQGFDLELISEVANTVTVPIIASGGMGTIAHAEQAVSAGADAVAMAHVLHYNKVDLEELRDRLARNYSVRRNTACKQLA